MLEECENYDIEPFSVCVFTNPLVEEWMLIKHDQGSWFDSTLSDLMSEEEHAEFERMQNEKYHSDTKCQSMIVADASVKKS